MRQLELSSFRCVNHQINIARLFNLFFGFSYLLVLFLFVSHVFTHCICMTCFLIGVQWRCYLFIYTTTQVVTKPTYI